MVPRAWHRTCARLDRPAIDQQSRKATMATILGEEIGAAPAGGTRPAFGAAGRVLGMRSAPRRLSLQVKLVIAFLLVSLVPTLIAAQLTARVVSLAFERNIEIWLTETSTFLLNEIVSSQREATGLARFVVDHTSMANQLENGTNQLPASVSALLDVLGYDLVTVY